MIALQLIESIPRYLLTRAIGAAYRPAFWSPLTLLQLRQVPEPALPGRQWVKIQTRYGGICGSDMHVVRLEFNPSMTVFTSLPLTLGHENVGRVAEVGPDVDGFVPGDRVVVDPLLPCATRGINAPCEYCQRGEFSLCQNFTNGSLAPGISIGFCRDTGGSWGPYFVAHRSQLFRVPDNVSDENALLVEPFAVALHPVLHNFPDDDDVVLVLGAGTIGLCTVAALRAAGSGARVIVVARYPFQGEMAKTLGADQVIYQRDSDYLQAVAQATGARTVKPLLGEKFLMGGADVVYECVGSRSSVNDALRFTRGGGTVVMIGFAAILSRIDWTPIWLNELSVRGSQGTGTETFQGRRVRTLQLVLEWMAEGRVDLAPLVTHRFRLEQYRQALAVTASRGQNRVIKSTFEFK